MNKKQLQSVAAILVVTVLAIIFWRLTEPRSSLADPTSETGNTPTAKSTNAVSESTRNDGASNIDPAMAERPMYQMTETKSSFDPLTNADRKKVLSFRMFASGGVGKIVDREGNTILQSDEKNAIFKCEVSPNETRIAVHRGSGKYDIITPSTGETIRLPQQPPGENVLGFASWHWIDDQTLIGVSGKTIPFRDDQVGPEREEPLISRSVLYVYDLKNQKMSEVALPPALRTKTVSVSAVDETGKVQLRPEGREVSYTDASLGWFEVLPKE